MTVSVGRTLQSKNELLPGRECVRVYSETDDVFAGVECQLFALCYAVPLGLTF